MSDSLLQSYRTGMCDPAQDPTVDHVPQLFHAVASGLARRPPWRVAGYLALGPSLTVAAVPVLIPMG
jgi:hypothetical protein